MTEKKITLQEMIYRMEQEATSIRAVQSHLLQEGYIQAPHDYKLREAQIKERIARLLLRLQPYMPRILEMIDNEEGKNDRQDNA